MKYSMNLLLWGNQIDDSLFPTLELIKEIGFDGVEVPIFNTNPEHWFKFRKKLDDLGLAASCAVILWPATPVFDVELAAAAECSRWLRWSWCADRPGPSWPVWQCH